MSTISRMVEDKRRQWSSEALMFCALHGRKGGEFTICQWANGNLMAEPVGGHIGNAITVHELENLKRNGWMISPKFSVGSRVRFKGSYTSAPRTGRIAEITRNELGTTIYVLTDGGRFGFNELEAD